MSDPPSKRDIQFAVRTNTSSSTASNLSVNKAPSLKSPRTARFAEATTVNSPIDGRLPFSEPPSRSYMAQPQVSDVGFGYVNKHESVEMPDTDYNPPLTAKMPMSPLKSAMRTPGAPPKNFGAAILSPTFKEEQMLEKHEQHTDKQQAKDLAIKTRVRVAKFLLRGVSFSCSLIVIAMLSATFNIFYASRNLPPRNNLPPWAPKQKIWPQVLLLSIACVSLVFCTAILYSYWKGGHRKAEKVAVYFTAFSVAIFIVTIVMWSIGAAVLQTQRTNSNNKDMWGWSCVNNERKSLFENEVDYELICRLQNWSLVCAIIEIVVELIVIMVTAVVFYRYWTRRRLRKSMAARDRARSDLYLAQLRSQSAPNTPGFGGPLSPRDGGWRAPTGAEMSYAHGPALEDSGSDHSVQYISATPKSAESKQAPTFKLQPPPIKITGATPKMSQQGFSPVVTAPRRERTPSPEDDQRSPFVPEVQQEHFAHRAPGEMVYAEVPIPGAYETPQSPGFAKR
ncbi:unnamed protein product [Zymoseptoria tritici ST99CH_1A5]|uniref:MARVEL domain-containing protein n=2 Tax=Zymoseptoria tritici TaxID=1047171 RepID=A0A2H1GP98_ZYMTR|nr:unnamed protein product [Zymoseptoria tritici ST99CH_1E4]SMR57801.1 unnamed protein product [Zymoseptoria tritici ST99CH_3D1]SMY26236.1 unnamed protein product [Zymoseptoria tritici ST99CH_1A5]